MSATWPPPGTACVRLDIDLNDVSFPVELAYSGTRPVDINTCRLERLGGPNAEDLSFRAQLYESIGAVAVAGGHAEAAMQRVILVGQGDPNMQFKDADSPWSQMMEKLDEVALSNQSCGPRLSRTLAWARKMQIAKRRHDAIHAYWWAFSGTGAMRTRTIRKKESFAIVGTLDGLRRDAKLIFAYAERLDDMVESDWPQARFLAQGESAFHKP